MSYYENRIEWVAQELAATDPSYDILKDRTWDFAKRIVDRLDAEAVVRGIPVGEPPKRNKPNVPTPKNFGGACPTCGNPRKSGFPDHKPGCPHGLR